MSTDRSSDWEALFEWAEATAGLALPTVQREQLRLYLDILLLWNRKLALVSQPEPTQIINKHIADSLFAAARCKDGEAVVDLGSGAGFPGLPIAIARPAAHVCLIEARGKKASFLEEVCRTASIRNALVCHTRIETASADPVHRQRYDLATARALTTTTGFLNLARPFLGPDGRALAMRSVTEPRAAELPESEEVPYRLPDLTPRRLLIMRP